jgi:hypothetical protein
MPLRRPSLRTILLHFYLVASLFTVGSEITSIWLPNCGVHDMAQISSANHDANKVQAIRAGSGALMTKERCPMLVPGGIQCNHPATVVPQSWEVPPYCVPGRPICEECYRELRVKAFGSWAA